jgi:prophage antirepressor-like protein
LIMENTMAKIFQNQEFGVIEVIIIDGKYYFPATDCAKMLGYTNPQKAIKDHCRTPGVTFRSVGVQTGIKADGSLAMQQVKKKYIDEGNLYRLITHSKLPSAECFESWIFDEVIPEIRVSGGYSLNVGTKSDSELAGIISQAVTTAVSETVNQIMKQIVPLLAQHQTEQGNSDEYEENITVIKRTRKKSKQPKVIETLPPNIRLDVDNMIANGEPYRKIKIYLSDYGVKLSEQAIGKYTRQYFN